MTTPARTDRDAGLERASALGAVVRTIAATTPAHPMVVKELFGVEGLPRTASSLTDGKTPAAADSDPVAMMRAAGYTPVALTRTHEHAWGITTRSPDGTGACNPHDPSRIAGGSSGGSAVCVAVGAVDVALGSDTAGSIRVPAAFCGVLGIRPTFDAISLRGVQGLAPTLDAPGLLCAGVAAAAPAMRALGLPTGYDGSPRLGVIADPTLPVLRADLAAVIAAAIAALGNPPLLDTPPAAEIHRAFVAVQLRDALAYHRDVLGFWPGRAEEYGADVRGRLELAEASTPPADLDQTRATLRGAWLAATEGVDALLMPVAACGPSTIATPDLVDVDGVPTPLRDLVIPFTAPASLFGLPAFSVPVGVDRDGLPVGLQLIGRPGGEAALLSVATMVEQVLSSVH